MHFRNATLLALSPLLFYGFAFAQIDEVPPTPSAPGGDERAASTPHADRFVPPEESEIPDNEFGDMVKYGRDLFTNTQQLRGEYVGNGLNCVNCHLDAGRKPNSAPLWAAWTMYPAFRGKTGNVNTMEERIQGCFLYSMNGTPPPSGSRVLTALMSYHYWMATGAPTGVELAGRGYPEVPAPAEMPDVERGKVAFQEKCSVCHGAEGEGKKVDGNYVFPALWGADSYNWGAGMHRINTAAAFLKHNMPLGQGGSLSDQEAWDIASYVNSHERPQDPRYEEDLAETDAMYHEHQCFYGEEMQGEELGIGDS